MLFRSLAEKKARELGHTEITGALLDQFKSQMMGGMGGSAGMAAAAADMAAGRLPWTAAARERLEAVPEFMRGMIRQIAEELAREGGHMEVNVELFEKVEALGDVQEAARPPTPEARRRGTKRSRRTTRRRGRSRTTRSSRRSSRPTPGSSRSIATATTSTSRSRRRSSARRCSG